MKKKIIISIFIIITIFQAIVPLKTNAFIEKTQITSTPGKIEKYKTESEVNEATGVDVITGLMLEPTVELFTVVIDAVASLLTSVMTSNNFEEIMISYDELEEKGLTLDPNNPVAGLTQFTIDNEENYRGAVLRINRDKIS